jgi:hypothetical protein
MKYEKILTEQDHKLFTSQLMVSYRKKFMIFIHLRMNPAILRLTHGPG